MPRKKRTDEPTELATTTQPEVLPVPLADEVLDQVAEKIRHAQRSGLLDTAMAIGKIIVEDIYAGDLDAWRDRGSKDTSFRKLAEREDLGVSRSTLHRRCTPGRLVAAPRPGCAGPTPKGSSSTVASGADETARRAAPSRAEPRRAVMAR